MPIRLSKGDGMGAEHLWDLGSGDLFNILPGLRK